MSDIALLQELPAVQGDVVVKGCCALASFATCPTRTFETWF